MSLLRRKNGRRRRVTIDVFVGVAGKNAGMNFARVRRARLRRSCFARDRRLADQRRAVKATELQRIISFNAIASGAALHSLERKDSTRSSERALNWDIRNPFRT